MRRKAQLLEARPDLEIVPLRGNVDTRIRRCHEGAVDAVILARAGLERLGLLERATETLDAAVCLPAVGQGALAVERREPDVELQSMLDPLVDAETAVAVAAERGVMIAVEGSCQIPVAALAVRDQDQLWLRGMLAEPDGLRLRRRELRLGWPASEAEAHQAGLQLGRELRQSK